VALVSEEDSTRPPLYIEGRVHRDNEWWASGAAVHDVPDQWRALRSHQYLLCADTHGTVYLLFDLADDPDATANLAGIATWKEVQDQLLAQLCETANQLGDQIPLARRA
jgi:hypothetical protein